MAVVVPSTGQRDKIVSILARPAEDLPDESGAPIDGPWTEMAVVWMSKSAATGFDRSAERYTADQTSSRVETVWHMPYLAEMDPDALDVSKLRRLQFGALTHDIQRAEVLTFEEGQPIRIWTRARPGA